MKFLVVDDEHELYKVMYEDMFKTKSYDVEEVPKFVKLNFMLKFLKSLHFNEKINRHISLPFKEIWNSKYYLSNYKFNNDEEYWIIFLNGSLRNYYSEKYLMQLKEINNNIKLCLVLYDSVSNPSSSKAVQMLPVFDKVFSFDVEDCKKYEFEYIYSTFSYPEFVRKDESYSSSLFFVGFPAGREQIINSSINKIVANIPNAKFIIPGKSDCIKSECISTKPISYYDELLYTYNTNCVFEVLREGQTGISLRTCEAIMFNKRLLTNNASIKSMPFYDSRYISVFSKPEEIDINFIKNNDIPVYSQGDWFSPLIILRKLNGE